MNIKGEKLFTSPKPKANTNAKNNRMSIAYVLKAAKICYRMAAGMDWEAPELLQMNYWHLEIKSNRPFLQLNRPF